MPIAAPDNTRPVRSAHRIEEAGLARYLAQTIPGWGGRLEVRQFAGGQSNPTYWLSDSERELVLRKKPPGKLLASAHAVEREYRVMRALADTDVPVARTYVLCEDAHIIGTPFFVMEYVAGRIFWNVQLPDCSHDERTALYAELIRILAALHRVDVAKVGLGDYGKMGGYVPRQVSRWTQQYQASQTESIPSMEALIEWLPRHVPTDDETTLTHGDFRLDNLIFHPTAPQGLAVIDWELSTLGHPLCDLAYLCMLYDVSLPNVGGLRCVDFATTGIPDEQSLIAQYCSHTGRTDVSDWPYFKAFSLFRLAAIAQGVYTRSLQGNASSENAGMFGQAVRHLSELACRLVGVPTESVRHPRGC